MTTLNEAAAAEQQEAPIAEEVSTSTTLTITASPDLHDNHDNNNDDDEKVKMIEEGKKETDSNDVPKQSASSSSRENSSGRSSNDKTKGTDISNVFFCPITKKLFRDPVVAPDGNTYERNAIVERGKYCEKELYPNRALQSILEEKLSVVGDDIRSKLLRFDKSMKSKFREVLDQSIIGSNRQFRRPLPDSFYCPITFEIIWDPVIDPEGNTFERKAIEKWIDSNNHSPLTRKPLSKNQLYDNIALDELIDEEMNRTESSIHPSIRRWKEQKPQRMLQQLEDEQQQQQPHQQQQQDEAGERQYPTTMEEREERLRLQRAELIVERRCVTIWWCTLALIFIFLPYYVTVLFISLTLLFICARVSENVNRRSD